MEKIIKTPHDLVTQFFESVWHAPHDLDAIDRFMTEDYKITTAGSLISGRENFKNWVKGFQRLLLDAKTESIDLFYDPSKTKVISAITGKFKKSIRLDRPFNSSFWTFKIKQIPKSTTRHQSFDIILEKDTCIKLISRLFSYYNQT